MTAEAACDSDRQPNAGETATDGPSDLDSNLIVAEFANDGCVVIAPEVESLWRSRRVELDRTHEWKNLCPKRVWVGRCSEPTPEAPGWRACSSWPSWSRWSS
jgi:hypothetical protein